MTHSRDAFVGDEHYGESNRCSCGGIIIVLILLGLFVQIPAILSGNIIFMAGDPALYILSSVILYSSILIFILVFKILWDRRKRESFDDV